MTTDTSTFRYFGYRDLVMHQVNRTAAYAESLSPPRALSDEEIKATLDPNLRFYLGIVLQRQSSADNSDSAPLSLEHRNTHYGAVVLDIGSMVNARFVAVAEIRIVEPLAEVIPLFPASFDQNLAQTG